MENYTEIGEQIFNLVDNDKDKVNAFYDALSVTGEESKKQITQWFSNYVKDKELKDLYKQGQNNTGLYKWICSQEGFNFFDKHGLHTITQDNLNSMPIKSKEEITSDSTKIHHDIEDEDDEILSPRETTIKTNMSDGEYSSGEIDDEDEIEMALDAIENDSSDDVDIVFDIVDGSEDDDSSDDTYIDIEDGSDFENDEEEIHKKRIHLDHHVNKVVESIDDDEEVDRFVHKKYYVMKKKELGTTEKMNDLEDELDKESISYYDFGKNETIAIKIYESNEVKVNRILEKLQFKCRCVDIAHYTDNWYS